MATASITSVVDAPRSSQQGDPLRRALGQAKRLAAVGCGGYV